MKIGKTLAKLVVLILFVMLLASCTQSEPAIQELASTYAAQTLTAMPTSTAMPQSEDTVTPTPTSTATKSATPTPLPTVGPVGPFDFPENVNPLTGLMVAEPDNLNRRPVFVKVANIPPSGRPHAGLSAADMVFEYYIGYGGNRFIALFYGQNASKIGPVRSGRLVDPQLVSLYQGILGMEGAYVTILDRIVEVLGDRVISGRGTCPAICDDGRNIVTSVFGDSVALTALAEQRGVNNTEIVLEGMAFDPQPPPNGELGEQATILFSSVNRGEWRFDAETGQYLRWIEDTSGQALEMIPLVDRETEEQLAFSNVIVLFASHTEFTPAMHDITLWNAIGQKAVIFRDGQAFEGTWATPSNNQPIRFLDAEGEIFPLKPGNTWVVLFGVNSTIAEDDGSWTFNFALP